MTNNQQILYVLNKCLQKENNFIASLDIDKIIKQKEIFERE